mmetsp:Transcript_1247/g.3492  ORF Transcript_1247/g.3492 Transcript_1247/m.3492 type:complete len:94 (-) Transcript_1247:55-336(-)
MEARATSVVARKASERVRAYLKNEQIDDTWMRYTAFDFSDLDGPVWRISRLLSCSHFFGKGYDNCVKKLRCDSDEAGAELGLREEGAAGRRGG